MANWDRRRLAVALGMLVALAASCGGTDSPAAGSPPSQFASIPAPLEALRSASATVEGQVARGSDFLFVPGLFDNVIAVPATHQAHFTPDFVPANNPPYTSLSYCIYRFHIPGYADLPRLHYFWDQALPDWGNGWIGVGNLLTNRWDWHVNSAAGFFDLGTMVQYISSPGDELVAAVVLMGTAPADLNVLALGDIAPPAADLSADVTSGLAPLTVHFDGSGSTASGPIAKYEWDPLGTGTFTDTGTTPTFDYVYTEGGTFNAALRVTDLFGLTGNATLPVTVTGEPAGTWHALTVDTVGIDTGLYPSLAEVDGRPAIAYYDNAFNTGLYAIRYVRAADSHGTAWNAPVQIGLSGISGKHASLAVVNGNPAVAFPDSSGGALMYRRASDIDGAGWNAAVNVFTSIGASPRLVSLAVVNGNPAIAYADSLADLYYIRANNANGSSWPAAPVAIETTGTGAGDFGFLLIAGGKPAVLYIDLNTQDVKYARAADANGAAWDAPMQVTNMTGTGTTFSGAIVSGNPALALVNAVNNRLEYARADDAAGTSWPAPASILPNLSSGRRDPSLAMVAGRPSISYFDADNGELMYLRAADANGAAWGTPVAVDTPPGQTTGWYSSLAQIGTQPGIAYYNFTTSDLHFAMQYP